jgi:hypothetical protein
MTQWIGSFLVLSAQLATAAVASDLRVKLRLLDDAEAPQAAVTKTSVCTPSITVYTDFKKEHSELSFEVMKEEVTLIFAPVGLKLQWHSFEPSLQNDRSAELVVVSFKGKCRTNELVVPRLDTRNSGLGWCYRTESRVTGYCYLDCDSIQRFINPAELRILPWVDRDRVLGRALGRVLAHELYHILLGTKRHSARGLAKASFAVDELISDQFGFEESDVDVLRNTDFSGLVEPGCAA